MKRILALLISAAIMLGVPLAVSAEGEYTITPGEGITVYVNGEEISEVTTVSEEDAVKLVAADGEGIVATTTDGVYYPLNEEFTLTADMDMTDAFSPGFGLTMVDGAQVRVGEGILTDTGKLNREEDSGLRFLATADYTDTVIADESVEFGIKIVAEGSEVPVYIKAEKFQNSEGSVYTAAITNLSESNYNRNYTATAYALVPMHDGTIAEFETENSVTRSIYQVSVGILKSSSAEYNDKLAYTINDAVKAVLSAYVNQTGIRLSYAKDGTMTARESGKGAYAGDLYFNVTSSLNDDGSTFVTVTPLGAGEGFFNSVTIPAWWKEYVRVNNNNTIIQDYIYDEKIDGDGVLTFTFRLPDTTGYTFDQEDEVTVVSEVTGEQIKGFKAGEAVTYSLADTVAVLGLAESMDEIVPGCVIMVGTNSEGDVAAVELLASMGMPIKPANFEADYGVYSPSDGSSKYQNIVAKYQRQSGKRITCNGVQYTLDTAKNKYKVMIAMNNNVPEVSVEGSLMKNTFPNTSEYDTYVYLRHNTETGEVTQCIYYRVDKNVSWDDDEYSGIFSLDNYRVILD